MLAVVCVLKSGGDYSPDYVEKLRNTVATHLTIPHTFICYTDIPTEVKSICVIRPLLKDLRGWWSKIEIFAEIGPTIYLDLDTFIFKSINSLTKCLILNTFHMLTPFGPDEKWASGIMVWNGDFSYINYEFIWEQSGHLRWDQRYIAQKLQARGVEIRSIQSILPGIKSYKYHCRKELKEDASIVCFHGASVRPHTIQEGWVKEVWDAK